MRRLPCWLLLLLVTGALTGCVERRFVITSQPMGALVYYQGKPIGTTPCDLPFLYYGQHDFTFVKDGYETKVERYDVQAPWYQYPGLDFVSEVLFPCTLKDVQYINADLQQSSRQVPNLVPRALELRSRVQNIQSSDPQQQQQQQTPLLPAMQPQPQPQFQPPPGPVMPPPGPPIQPRLLPPQPLPPG